MIKKKLQRYLTLFRGYIYDSRVDIKDRSFIVFSIAVLIALFAAIPCGLIMHEPPIATISTAVGAVFFTLYVIYSVRRGKIARARFVISIILVFVFLPAMFFTNGGVYGGTPIWLLLGTIYITMILDGRFKIVMMTSNVIVMIISWIIGYMYPELIDEYSRGGNYFDTIAGLFIVGGILYILISFQNNLYRHEEAHKNVQRLFAQTATALVSAIDAKDKYTHGHSSRVAEYSRKIAELSGKTETECDEIYYSALLHDVGKIGVPEDIINKEGKLTTEEFNIIKLHPVWGANILHSISEFPNLSVGANYHHERYNGRGYPENLKGTDIPEVARIISVADAYDAMTSKRSYRDPLPQQKVREEFVECSGTQFDPEFARLMIHMIDLDTEYEMKERGEIMELAGTDELAIKEYRSIVSEGILLSSFMTHIRVNIRALDEIAEPVPSMILFDSLDGRFHDYERDVRELLYFEYGEIWFDGRAEARGARKVETKLLEGTEDSGFNVGDYDIEALKMKDHVLVRIIGYDQVHQIIMALPDSTRYVYLGFTGANCCFMDCTIDKSEIKLPEDYIPRIADKISYINVPAGDVPNVQIDGYRTDATEGILIRDGMCIAFHTKCLPTARLVWHCPFINIYSSDDGTTKHPSYRDLMLMRLDGECWESDPECSVTLSVNMKDSFEGWDEWKALNKRGYECTVTFERNHDHVVIRTENAGICIKNTVTMNDGTDTLYASLTGDQCALTNIRISL
ncbi:MAG: HD domain-containing protein [Lachnospiraceae bacterium]|nr:HD domain-containing protein [Lachnospiraceae bacterium]